MRVFTFLITDDVENNVETFDYEINTLLVSTFVQLFLLKLRFPKNYLFWWPSREKLGRKRRGLLGGFLGWIVENGMSKWLVQCVLWHTLPDEDIEKTVFTFQIYGSRLMILAVCIRRRTNTWNYMANLQVLLGLLVFMVYFKSILTSLYCLC